MTLPVASSMFLLNTEPTHLKSFFFFFSSSCFTEIQITPHPLLQDLF